MKKVVSDMRKEDMPLYPIGVVAELIGITEQTLRLYEKHGLINLAWIPQGKVYTLISGLVQRISRSYRAKHQACRPFLVY